MIIIRNISSSLPGVNCSMIALLRVILWPCLVVGSEAVTEEIPAAQQAEFGHSPDGKSLWPCRFGWDVNMRLLYI